MRKNCKVAIDVYDPRCTEPPFKLIVLHEMEVDLPDIDDDHGYGLAIALSKIAYNHGYVMRFYSSNHPNHEYKITVHNKNSPGSPNYPIDHLKEYYEKADAVTRHEMDHAICKGRRKGPGVPIRIEG